MCGETAFEEVEKGREENRTQVFGVCLSVTGYAQLMARV